MIKRLLIIVAIIGIGFTSSLPNHAQGEPPNPSLLISDNHTKDVISQMGINPDNCQLVKDYGLPTAESGVKASPYTRTYQDSVSKRYVAEINQLPMVNALGNRVVPQWVRTVEPGDVYNRYVSGKNQFSADIYGTTSTVTLINDQPNGLKTGDNFTTSPQLLLDGVEIPPVSRNPTLLPVDPINPEYQNNTLEWSYGTNIKRRIRIIEGHYLGSWIFYQNPNANVTLNYNLSGTGNLKLGLAKDSSPNQLLLNVTVTPGQEYIPKAQWNNKTYPVIIGDSATYYPDAHAESTSVDGRVAVGVAETTWTALVAHAGTWAADSETAGAFIYIDSGTTSGKWEYLYRSIFLFDTSGLDDAATISAATFSVYGYPGAGGKADLLGITPNVNVYSSAPASNTALVAGDYDSLGTTAYCDTAITYAGFSTTGYNDWVFNATGIAAVSKTGVTKLGVRNANYDVPDSAPTWSSNTYSQLIPYYSEQGVGYQPKLVVVYTLGWTHIGKDKGVPQANIAKKKGILKANIGKIKGIVP